MPETLTDLVGKNALVTGASRGIGRTIAVGLAARGAAVAVHYNRNQRAAEQVVQAITEDGGTAYMSSPSDCADARIPRALHCRRQGCMHCAWARGGCGNRASGCRTLL